MVGERRVPRIVAHRVRQRRRPDDVGEQDGDPLATRVIVDDAHGSGGAPPRSSPDSRDGDPGVDDQRHAPGRDHPDRPEPCVRGADVGGRAAGEQVDRHEKAVDRRVRDDVDEKPSHRRG
jgi:hypothetical protein